MNPLTISDRRIGPGEPAYIIAEMSANHGQDLDEAVRIVHAAKEAGADAIKLQTYTPDTMTIDCDADCFQVGAGTIWEGRQLYELYGEAHTPWDWQPRLKQAADEIGIHCFSTPFDDTAVNFLETLQVPAYKIASFELIDVPLLKRVAVTKKPIIMSTGMATLAEIAEAVEVLRGAGVEQLALLKCTSAYPAPAEEMNLHTIAHLSQAFSLPTGLSDHTLGLAASVASVALGACIIEKHFTLSREKEGPDSSFSLEPQEFRDMVDAVRTAEKALGTVRYGIGEHEAASRVFRRSLFFVQDVKAGDILDERNVRSIRPGDGLAPKHFPEVLGRPAKHDIVRGTPVRWRDVA